MPIGVAGSGGGGGQRQPVCSIALKGTPAAMTNGSIRASDTQRQACPRALSACVVFNIPPQYRWPGSGVEVNQNVAIKSPVRNCQDSRFGNISLGLPFVYVYLRGG